MSTDNPEVLCATSEECHGRCFGRESERSSWVAPRLVARSAASARPGYDSKGASEYVDAPDVVVAKVRFLADLIKQSKRCVVYSGAGLSTSAGISDYATQAADSVAGNGLAADSAFKSPFCAQPTLSHRALVALHRNGDLYRWVNQNHDGLPQKAGLPQESINEIHGAWFSPDNPVIPMSGCLRDDLFEDLLNCEREADLVLALGSSLCGMNADRTVVGPAQRAAAGSGGQFGSVIIGLQQTIHDKDATLRIFSPCDAIFSMLMEHMGVELAEDWPEGTFFQPGVLVGRAEDDYVFERLSYDFMGEYCLNGNSYTWDLRSGADLVIPRGMHAGAVGEVDGFDREGNIKCRFKLKPKSGKLRAFVPMVIGRWWIQAAFDSKAVPLPVVNLPRDDLLDPSAIRLRELIAAYAV